LTLIPKRTSFLKYTLITEKLLAWYKKNGRDLPWRNTRDPYKIWLSEIILQQTRVNQGMPYYHKFVEKYPSIFHLAEASEQEVLRTWQGLGYYSRARNLHACAKILVDKYNCEFPKNYDEILKLPGVGKYTAAAIASFAFKELVPAIDGNVFRVLSRLFGIDKDILSAKNRKIFEEAAYHLIPENAPDDFNQAMMEFGAMHCTPKNPKCSDCPINLECFARLHNKQEALPIKKKKVKVRTRHFNYLILKNGQKVWMKERVQGDIWQGLYDFPLWTDSLGVEGLLSLEKKALEDLFDQLDVYKHILTHQVIYAKFLLVEISAHQAKELNISEHKGDFYSIDEVNKLPKPVLVSRYLNEAIF